jgi:mannose-6-phosphate isomerase-like protein (cupin superfamily)
MAHHVPSPTIIQAHGTPPKQIEEYIGAVNSDTPEVSISRMLSPAGWAEPGQTPEFDEYTVVLSGSLRVETKEGVLEVGAGQAVITPAGEWVRYSTPAGPAEYISVCLPAFTPATVHRDE